MKKLIAMIICSCVLFSGISLSAKKATEPKPAKKGEIVKECGCKYRARKGKKKPRLIKKCDACKQKASVKKPLKKDSKKPCTCAKCKKTATAKKAPAKKGKKTASTKKVPAKKCKKGCKCAKCKKAVTVKKPPVKKCEKGCKCAKCAKKGIKKGVEVIVLPEIDREKELPRFIEKEKENPKGMEKGNEKVEEKKEESENAWWKFW